MSKAASVSAASPMIRKSPAWLASASPSNTLLFSPDGQFLAVYAGDSRMQVWHVERGQAILPESSPGWTWDFSPDSRQVAIGRPDGSIDLYDLSTGKETRRLQGASALVSIAFDPSSRRLAVCYQATSAPVQVWDLASGAILSKWDIPTAQRLGPRLASRRPAPRPGPRPPRQSCRGLGCGGPTPDRDHGRPRARGDRPLLPPRWQPARYSLLRRHEAAVGRRDGPASAATGQTSSACGSARTGTGSAISATVAEVQLVEVAAAQEYRTLVSSGGAGAIIGPDGRLLAVGTGDGVRLSDLASGRELDSLPLGPTSCRLLSGGRTRTPDHRARAASVAGPCGIRGRRPGCSTSGRHRPFRCPSFPTVPSSARTVTPSLSQVKSRTALVVDLPGGAVRSSLAHPGHC